MSDTTAAPPGGTAAAPAATPAGSDNLGPRRAAPGLSHMARGGTLTLSQGVAALARGNGAAVAPAGGDAVATPATPATPAGAREPPARREAPFQLHADAAADPPQRQPQQQPPPRAPVTPQPQRQAATATETLMAAFMPGADATRAADPAAATPQPAPANVYLQGVPITVDGQERHFSVAELTDAIGKASDYTKKTQALAEQARTIDQLLPIMMPEIERQIAALDGHAANEPDWNKLAAELATNPAEYNRRFAAHQTELRAAATERARLASLVEANQRREAAQRAERMRISHTQLVRTLPGWGQEATRTALVNEMRVYATKNGYPAGELDSIVEARHIETLAKAMMFDRMMEQVRTQQPHIPLVRRGTAPAAPVLGAISDAQQRFDANPTNRTGLSLLMAKRAAERRVNGAA